MPRGWLPASPHAERGEQPAAGRPGERLQASHMLRAGGFVVRWSSPIASKSAAVSMHLWFELCVQRLMGSTHMQHTLHWSYPGPNCCLCLQDHLRAHQICRTQHASAAALSTHHSSAQVRGEIADITHFYTTSRPFSRGGGGGHWCIAAGSCKTPLTRGCGPTCSDQAQPALPML